MVAKVLELLDAIGDSPGRFIVELDPGVACARVNSPPSRELGDQQLAAVADHIGIDVLERGRVGAHRGDVHPTFVRERVASDVRLVGIGSEVEKLVEEVGR